MGWKVLELFLDKNSKYWILNPEMYIAGIFDIKSGFMTKKVGFIAILWSVINFWEINLRPNRKF